MYLLERRLPWLSLETIKYLIWDLGFLINCKNLLFALVTQTYDPNVYEYADHSLNSLKSNL